MKVLTIIGLVISTIGILLSITIFNMTSYTAGGNIIHGGEGQGVLSLFVSLYFLAFSIVATVKSFQKKNN